MSAGDPVGVGIVQSLNLPPSGDAGNARRAGRARREAARGRPPSRGSARTAGPETKVQ
jgi:hypothetical protein